jgi:hypothetical protein
MSFLLKMFYSGPPLGIRGENQNPKSKPISFGSPNPKTMCARVWGGVESELTGPKIRGALTRNCPIAILVGVMQTARL